MVIPGQNYPISQLRDNAAPGSPALRRRAQISGSAKGFARANLPLVCPAKAGAHSCERMSS
jgi:hypothetical protein